MNSDTRAKEIMTYSLLIVLANNDTVYENELRLIEKLALKDAVVDEEGKMFSELYFLVSTVNILRRK